MKYKYTPNCRIIDYEYSKVMFIFDENGDFETEDPKLIKWIKENKNFLKPLPEPLPPAANEIFIRNYYNTLNEISLKNAVEQVPFAGSDEPGAPSEDAGGAEAAAVPEGNPQSPAVTAPLEREPEATGTTVEPPPAEADSSTEENEEGAETGDTGTTAEPSVGRDDPGAPSSAAPITGTGDAGAGETEDTTREPPPAVADSSTEENMEDAEITETTQAAKVYQCKKCDFTADKPYKLGLHTKAAHPAEKAGE